MINIFCGILILKVFSVKHGQSQVIENTRCSDVAQSNGAQVAQMCHDSSAASSQYLAMDVSAAKSVMSSHPVAECTCSLSIRGGTSIALSPLTDIISPTEGCGTEIEITADGASDSYRLRCTSNVVNGIAGTVMSIVLRRDDFKPEDGYSFDYCLVIYIRSPTRNAEISLSCDSPIEISSSMPPITPSATQCYTELQTKSSVAQMCHTSSATGSDYVILDIMAAEAAVSPQEVTKCACSVSIEGGNEFGFARATHGISPSNTCGTRLDIITNDPSLTGYQLECESSQTQVPGDSATILFSMDTTAPTNGYNYDYCLSVYISRKVGAAFSSLTLTCFNPQETTWPSTLPFVATTSASQTISTPTVMTVSPQPGTDFVTGTPPFTMRDSMPSSSSSQHLSSFTPTSLSSVSAFSLPATTDSLSTAGTLSTTSIALSSSLSATTAKSQTTSAVSMSQSVTALPDTSSQLPPTSVKTKSTTLTTTSGKQMTSLTKLSQLPTQSITKATSTVRTEAATTHSPTRVVRPTASFHSLSTDTVSLSSSVASTTMSPPPKENITKSSLAVSTETTTAHLPTSFLSSSASAPSLSAASISYSEPLSKKSLPTSSQKPVTPFASSSVSSLDTYSTLLSVLYSRSTLSLTKETNKQSTLTTLSSKLSSSLFSSASTATLTSDVSLMPNASITETLSVIFITKTSPSASSHSSGSSKLSTEMKTPKPGSVTFSSTLSNSIHSISTTSEAIYRTTLANKTNPSTVSKQVDTATAYVSTTNISRIKSPSLAPVSTPVAIQSTSVPVNSATFSTIQITKSTGGSQTFSPFETPTTALNSTGSSFSEETNPTNTTAATTEPTSRFPLEVVISVPVGVVAIIVFGLCIFITSRKEESDTESEDSDHKANKLSSWSDIEELSRNTAGMTNSNRDKTSGYYSFSNDASIDEDLQVSEEVDRDDLAKQYWQKLSGDISYGQTVYGEAKSDEEQDKDCKKASEENAKKYMVQEATIHMEDDRKPESFFDIYDQDVTVEKRKPDSQEEAALPMIQVLIENNGSHPVKET